MDDFIEITELSDTPSSGHSKSVNFGGGLEFLMNDKIKSGSGSGGKSNSGGDLDDLSNLEFELNNLTDTPNADMFETFEPSKTNTKKSGGGKGDLFGSFFETDEEEPRKKDSSFSINVNKTLGEETANSAYSNQSTWDGYSKINTPINSDLPFIPPESAMSKEDSMMEKFKLLKKIENLERKGMEFSKKYNMESSFQEMKCEYDTIMEDKAKQASIKFQANMMMSVVNGIEYLNGKFDPFDINLDGWSEQVNESITDYDDIFGELYDMYKDKTHVSPWLRLIFQLGGSGMMVHMTNTMFKSAMPNMDDILRQNPDLMRQFQSAAVNSMGQSNPGFSNFMNGVMNGGMGAAPINMADGVMGQPTMPSQSGDYFSQSRGGNNMFGAASSMNNMMPPPPPRQPHSDLPPYKNQPPSGSTQSRPDMKGPADISDILSGLKTKTVNISQPSPPIRPPPSQSHTINMNENSTISINDLKDLSAEGTAPKKSKRRQRSDKNASNTLSLAL